MTPLQQVQQALRKAQEAMAAAQLGLAQASEALALFEALPASKQPTGADATAVVNPYVETPLTAVMDYLNFLQESEGLSDQAHAQVSEAVMAYLTFLQDEGDASTAGVTAQQTARLSSAHLLSLINDLLEYAKVLQGERGAHLTEVPLRQTLSDIHHSLAPRAASKHLEYVLAFDDDLPAWVKLDAASLTMVLIEVVDNAIKFTERGHVRVRVTMLSRQDQQGMLGISVADSGIGIDAKDWARIFEPFVQLTVSKDGEQDEDLFGHGLGLAMAEKLARLQGATLHVNSRLGEGTTMDIHWPVQVVQGSVAATQAEQAEREGTGDGPAVSPSKSIQELHILVVDDHQLNRLVALSALKRHFPHAQLDEAKNGVEALEKMSVQRYDLVLMDLVMPDLSGTEVVRRVRALSAPLNSVAVVALTANIADEAMTECEHVGITHVLSKPLDLDLLVKTVREVTAHTS